MAKPSLAAHRSPRTTATRDPKKPRRGAGLRLPYSPGLVGSCLMPGLESSASTFATALASTPGVLSTLRGSHRPAAPIRRCPILSVHGTKPLRHRLGTIRLLTCGGVNGGVPAMKNIVFWAVIASGLITGTAVVMTYHPHHAQADCSTSGC
jgi:hypothetical protein